MQVKTITCSTCGDTIYSRCKEEDNGYCHCQLTYISGDPMNPTVEVDGVELVCPQLTTTEISISAQDLYWDWNLMLNHYGFITEITDEETVSHKQVETGYRHSYLMERYL